MMIDLSAVDVEDLLRRLDLSNVRLTSSGTEVNFSFFGTDHRHGDQSPSAYINVETTAGFCHGCHLRWNAVSLVMQVNNVARITAERSLREWYGIEFSEPVGGSMVSEVEDRMRVVVPRTLPTPPPASWLSNAHVDWCSEEPIPAQQYMIDRGLHPHVLQNWDIGYDYLSDRVTIPVFSVQGDLVGIKGRDWTGYKKPKYLILGDRQVPRYGFQPYEAATVVFGLNRNRECRSVVLVEGEINAVALSQMGVPRPIATGMSYLSQTHAQLVAAEADEVVVFYDYGSAGHDGVWGAVGVDGKRREGVVAALEPHARVRVVEPEHEDPADMLRQGRSDECLEMIQGARSSLDLSLQFV